MTNSSYETRSVPESVFQKMLRGEVSAPFILRSELLQVSAIVDIHPSSKARGLQAVIFPDEPGPRSTWSMATGMVVAAAMQAVGNRILEVYPSADLAVMHQEGYDVPHGHGVVFPSFKRGDSAALHESGRLERRADPAALDAVAEALRFSPEDLARFERETIEGAREITLARL